MCVGIYILSPSRLIILLKINYVHARAQDIQYCSELEFHMHIHVYMCANVCAASHIIKQIMSNQWCALLV